MKALDLTGQTFGRLTVLHLHDAMAKRGYRAWRCLCSCGKERIVSTETLRSGATKSCGCLAKENAREKGRLQCLPDGQAAFNALYGSYKINARYRGHAFDLTKVEASILFKQNCYYCGVSPQQVHRIKAGSGNYVFNGIDRLDNAKAYVAENVVPCCSTCNYIKGTMHHNEFIAWIWRVFAVQMKPKQIHMDVAMDMYCGDAVQGDRPRKSHYGR
jgi:hypothetical protein